jgi:hypothetical protein
MRKRILLDEINKTQEKRGKKANPLEFLSMATVHL